MANTVRFYDTPVVDASGNYNDGSIADGSLGKGRFVITVDPFTYPGGTDGQWFEFDAIVSDPSDPTQVFVAYIGVNIALASSAVTGGFTFDSASPPLWVDWWGCYQDAQSSYPTFPDSRVFDGSFAPFDAGFVVAVDGASVANWWVQGPSAAPVITAPVAGTHYTPSADLPISIAWTEASQTHYQIVTSGAYVSDTGDVASSTPSATVTVPYLDLAPWRSGQSLTISVRARQGSAPWSSYASVTVILDPTVPTAGAATQSLVADAGSITLDAAAGGIPAYGAGIVVIATNTAITAVPSGWDLHDSGVTADGLAWYRYVTFTETGAGPWTWTVSSGGDVTGFLDAVWYDLPAGPGGPEAPFTIDDIVWGSISEANGDDCTAVGVDLVTSGQSLGGWLGYTTGGSWYPPYPGIWNDPFVSNAHGLTPPWLRCSNRPQGFAAGLTDDGIASPRTLFNSPVSVGQGGANLGCQIGLLDWQPPPAGGMGFVLGMATFP